MRKPLKNTAGRIGDVLYKLGCIVAGLITLLAVALLLPEAANGTEALYNSAFILFFALFSWSIGWTCRYALNAR